MGRIAKQIAITAAAAALFTVLFSPVPAQADFGIASFSATATNQDGSLDLLAGSHPFAFTFALAMNTDADGQPEGELDSLDVDLPTGLVGNPLAVPRCSRAEFDGAPHCPPGSQVGVISASAVGLGTVTAPVFNLVPPPGYAASFGLNANGNIVIEGISLKGSGAGAHLRVTTLLLPAGLGIKNVTQTLWGLPADAAHDGERAQCLDEGGTCPAGIAPAPLLTLPTSCGTPLTTTLGVRSLEQRARTVTASSTMREPGGPPLPVLDCGSLPFVPSLAVQAESAALTPTGLGVELQLPSSEAPFGRSSATVDRLSLGLPPGLTLNPPAAAGLAGCGPADIGLESAPGAAARFDAAAPECPQASKLGTATIETPVLDHPLRGGVYLATPDRNPYGALFAIYVVLDDPVSGTLIKLPGRLEADPGDGRIEATVEQIPQLPLGRIELDLSGGPRALLATPPTCGRFVTSAEAVPSSAPEGATAHLKSAFVLDRGPSGQCPPASPSNAPSLEAGGVEAIAGLQTPFVLRLRRSDSSQLLSSFDISLPPGLVARLAGVAVCSDAAAPACPPSSAVGTARVGAGVGPSPLYLPGTAYLAGPYRGAPFSLLVAVPVRAGPFDLGTVAVRAAVRVNPMTGQLSVASDPFPQILDGVPLAIRLLTVSFDRPGFVRNPTSCEPMTIGATVTSTVGQVTGLSNPFQVGDCAALGFRPRLNMRLAGPAQRGGHPSLRVGLRPRVGDANLRQATLTLPGGELLDSGHIDDVCTPDRYAARTCPAGSVYGSATIWSPLLGQPLRGSVYLRSSKRRLPELVASLHGEFHFDLIARLGSRRGHIQIGFGSIPDVPFSRVAIRLEGGKRGLVVNNGGLCRGGRRFRVGLEAQSGKVETLRPLAKARCDKVD